MPRPLISLALALATPAVWAVAAPLSLGREADRSQLPVAIQNTLDREYPGWIFAPASDPVRAQFSKHHATHSPALITADLDGDHSVDYVAQIALTSPGQEEQIVVAFMKRPGSYEEIIIESRGLDPDVYLWTRRETGAGSSARALLAVMGGPGGESSYAYEDGRFREVESAEPHNDDPDAAAP